MKHSNNMREKPTRKDNAEATAKKAAVEKRGSAHLGSDNDRIEIGKGEANSGVGVNRMIGPSERMAPFEDANPVVSSKDTTVETEHKKERNRSTWIKGSSESKKMSKDHNVKGKL
ncbi:MAG TPA: hypothetical protein VGK23_08890 [Methanomassiliicoccales archaeon]|jgi:hypothetical protein